MKTKKHFPVLKMAASRKQNNFKRENVSSSLFPLDRVYLEMIYFEINKDILLFLLD